MLPELSEQNFWGNPEFRPSKDRIKAIEEAAVRDCEEYMKEQYVQEMQRINPSSMPSPDILEVLTLKAVEEGRIKDNEVGQYGNCFLARYTLGYPPVKEN